MTDSGPGDGSVPRETSELPPATDAARHYFGEQLPLVEAYGRLLATEGVERGLIGPREVPRLWERHLLNCAVLGELVEEGVRVVDVGSGAGLPGLLLALLRPDLDVVLVEPMLRRTTFLSETVDRLGLTRVEVVRGRAEEPAVRERYGGADVVTARAVAAMDRLAAWCLPLVRPAGVLLALKGASAAEETEAAGAALRRLGGADVSIHTLGIGVVDPPAVVVRVVRGPSGGQDSGVRATRARPGTRERSRRR